MADALALVVDRDGHRAVVAVLVFVLPESHLERRGAAAVWACPGGRGQRWHEARRADEEGRGKSIHRQKEEQAMEEPT